MRARRLLPLALAAVFLAGCFSPELAVIDRFEAGKLYIVARISFENFQVEQETLPEGRRECFVIFTRRRDDFLGVGQGTFASAVRTAWDKHFAHALPKDGGPAPGYHVRCVYLALAGETYPVPFYAAEHFELLIDLRFDYDQDVSGVYLGDITFSLKDNDMFVAVADRYAEAQAYFDSLIKNDGDKGRRLEKRLLRGSDFVEIRKTTSTYTTMVLSPIF